MNAAYACLRRMYVRHGTKERSNFLERRTCELRRINLPRTPLNKARKRAEAATTPRPFSLIGALSVACQTRRHQDERSRELSTADGARLRFSRDPRPQAAAWER